MDANQDLTIDRDNLELEFQKQAHLYYQYSEQSANAIEDQQVAKEQVDILEAQLDNKIRICEVLRTGVSRSLWGPL